MSKIIGIDLGTTFSAVGYVQDGRAVILANGRERITPSVVGFSPAGALLVGTPARNQLVLYPEQTVKSIKRKMGTNETVHLNGRDYAAAEISAIILSEMKRVAERVLGEAVTRAVITVPAYFSDAARQATKEAGEIAGFTVERIINEPTAAALAYGLDRMEANETIAVYDLGGGTFDVSIIEINSGVLEVRASHGDVTLGGDDFDERLMNLLADKFQAEHGLNPRSDAKARARLLRAAEETKIALSTQPFVQVSEEYLMERENGAPCHLDLEVTRSDFEELIEDLLEGTLAAFDQALLDAGVGREQLDRVLFVGGSTRIPKVWELVRQHVGVEPTVAINPDEAVALGAGVQAALIAGEPIDAILVDVTPHSLGIEVAEHMFGQLVNDQFAPIIHRNSTIPATHAKQFSALYVDQIAIAVKIYQGESRTASENVLLGEYFFEDLERLKPDEPPVIMVQFDLDVNGILDVSIQDRGSGKRARMTVKAEHQRMDTRRRDEFAQLIKGLPRDETDVLLDAMPDDVRTLVERGRAVAAQSGVAAQGGAAERITGLIQDIESAVRLGDEALCHDLSEEMVAALYDAEE